MKKEDLKNLKEKLSKLTEEEKKQRDLYLRQLAKGEIEGPSVGYASIDKQWLKYYDENSILNDMPKMTMYQYLVSSNKGNDERVALNYFGKKITYKELINNIDNVCSCLLSNDIKKGDIVSISLPTLPETIYLLYAISKIGATANMIDPRTSIEGIENYINETKSTKLFVLDSIIDKVKNIKNNTTIEDIVVISPADSLPFGVKQLYKMKEKIENKKNKNEIDTTQFRTWENFYKIQPNNTILNDNNFDENRAVVIVHTGGTTGTPKGVKLSDYSLNAAAKQCIDAGFDFKREHTWMNIMPPFIAYGVGNGLHLPLVCGMEVILIPAFEAKKFADLMIKHKPNHMVGAPAPYEYFIGNKKMQKQDLSYIIAPTVGGDKMDIDLESRTNEFLKNHGCSYKITKGYGMTEVNAAVAACSNDDINELGTVGLPFPKEIIAAFDIETGEEVYNGKVGEICISGPNTMIGYYDNDNATNEILKKHEDNLYWIHSGDLGYIDKIGNLYIVDRIKRVIIRYDGFKIFPSVIENTISSIDEIKQCCVIGVNDEEHVQGKLPYAYFTTFQENVDEELLRKKIIEQCNNKLPEYFQLCGFERVDSIPFTPVGKVDFKAMEERYINNNKVLTLK